MDKGAKTLIDFFLAFFMPMVVGKSMVLYFGAMYSDEPGQGWGYGLAGAILFTLAMIGRFLWRYKDRQDL